MVDVSENGSSGERFGALNGIAGFVMVVGWIAIVVGIILFFATWVGSSRISDVREMSGYSFAGSAIMSGISIVLGAGAVRVLIAIEKNTRTKV